MGVWLKENPNPNRNQTGREDKRKGYKMRVKTDILSTPHLCEGTEHHNGT